MKSFSFKRSLAVLSACLLQAAGASAAVVITTPPQPAVVPDGAKITFTVVASSDSIPPKPLTYIWRKQGVTDPVKAESTSNQFVIAAAKNTDEGAYFVTVKEAGSSGPGSFLNSAPAGVVVNVRPKILVNPTAPATIPTANTSTNVPLSVTLTPESEGPFTYKWQMKSGSTYNDVFVESDIATLTHTFTIANVELADAGIYRVQVSNASNILANSKDLTLKVNSAPTIVTNLPTSFTVTHGSSGTLKVVAGGTAPFTYQWFKKSNTGGTFEPISKATKSSLSIKGTDVETAGLAEGPGKYLVQIRNTFSPTDSPTVSGEVDVVVIRKPKIVTQPAKQTAVVMTSAKEVNLSVVMDTTGNPGTLLYQWYKDGKIIQETTNPTAITSTLSFPLPTGATWSDRGSYRVVVRNAVGSVTSSTAVLTIVSPPIITSQSPPNVFGQVGGSVKLSVVATGTTPLTYAWYFRTPTGTFNFDAAPLSKSATLTVSKLSNTNHRGYYVCRVKNAPKGLTGPDAGAIGQVDSTAIYVQADEAPKITTKLAVLAYKPSVAPTPKIPADPTHKLHLTLTVSGTNRLADAGDDKANPMTYKWFKNKVLIPGATTNEYIVNGPTSADTGSYTCEASNFVGKVLSSALAIIVSSPPTIVTHPVDVTGTEEATIQMSVTATGLGTLKYQWQKYDESVSSYISVAEKNVSGKTSAKMSIGSSSVINAGTYRCVVSNEYGSTNSDDADVQVDLIPAPVIGPVPGVSTVAFHPQVARAGEKVRIYGQNLNYPATVKFGSQQVASGSVVYEPLTSSLLVTVPNNAPTTADTITVTTRGKLSTSLGGGTFTTTPTSENPGFRMTNLYENGTLVAPLNGIFATNATILTPTSTGALKYGDNFYSGNLAGEVIYTLKVPVPSFVSFTCDGLYADDFASVDIGMAILEETVPGIATRFVGPDGVTEYGAPRTSAVAGSPSEAISFVTTRNDTDLLIFVYGNPTTVLGMVRFGPFVLGYNSIPTKLSSNVTATVPYAPKTKVSLGAGDWQSTDAIGMTTESAPDSEGSPTVRVGGEGSSKEPVQLWSDAVDAVSGSSQAVASFRMSLEGTAEGDDQFSWQITSSTGKPLGAFWVDAATGEMKIVEPDGTVHESIQHMTPGGGAHRFEFQVDTAGRSWVGYIDGIQITEPVALPADAKFGSIYSVWDLGADGKASGSSMLFSDFVVEGR